jgi:hypothetical protein
MFGSTLLDVAIGITFIYLFLSLIGTAITEAMASFMKMRAKNLEEGIRVILNDPDGNNLTKQFYDHPLIRGLGNKERRPSYIPARAFASALLDTIVPSTPGTAPQTVAQIRSSVEGMANDDLKKVLLTHLDAAGDDIRAARENVEKWFDEGMERISGWYKRWSQTVIYVFAAFITLAMNVDTIHITTTLYHDAALRSGLVAAAEGAVKHGQDDPNGIQTIKAEMEKMKLPMGWSVFSKSEDVSIIEALKSIWSELPGTTLKWLVKLCGWTITLFAISLGAPFWFDTLSKFINVRASGKRSGTLNNV